MTMQTPNGKDTKNPLPTPVNGAGTPPRPPTALPIDLASLPHEQVAALAEEVPRELERRKAKLLEELTEAARALGVTPERLLAAAQRAKRESEPKTVKDDDGRHFVKAKYRCKTDPELTWSGRGNQPKWFADHLAGGGKPEDLQLPDDEA